MIGITIEPALPLLIIAIGVFVLGYLLGGSKAPAEVDPEKIVGTKEHLLKLHGWATPRNLEHRPLYEWVDSVTGLDWQRSSELCRKHGWDPHQSAAIPLSK